MCGTADMTCLSTVAAIDQPDTATKYLWVCPGTNYQLGGRDAFCEAPKSFCDTVKDVPKEECEALLSIYDNNGGDAWDYNTEWGVSPTVCNWYGVVCNDGHVFGLYLYDSVYYSNFGLTGNFEILEGNLDFLDTLYLNYNQLNSFHGAHMSTLKDLTLQSNPLTSFYGTDLGELQYLRLSDNFLTSFSGE